ncbi:MAG: SMC family ATPase [Clostridia bacterium]|nr:SMC family ATPase [Clostridia bacterium]
MKPVYLEFCGINSFSETAKIDFRALLSGGLFGIFGDTGSGKSTILDCIHFALYGVVDRVPKALSDCINYHCDGAYVVFDFEITTEGERHTYRVRRERKRKNGVSKAFLYECIDDRLQALAENTDEVNAALARIIGLTFNDFKMCIALPQGDFAALVKSTTAERVKLVARLFDLEKYGEKLFKKVNEKYFAADAEVKLVEAKMGENDAAEEGAIEAKEEEIRLCKESLLKADERLKLAEREWERLTALEKEKREYETICATLETYKNRLPAMEEKRALVERLPAAKGVAEKAAAAAEHLLKKTEAEKKRTETELLYAQACAKLAEKKSEQGKETYDEKILECSLQLDKVRAAQGDVEAAEAAKNALEDCKKEYNALRAKCPEEAFDKKLLEIDEKIAKLGEEDDLLSYLKHHFKDVFLPEAYGEFRADLRALQEKYPETASDVETLLKKYTPTVSGQQLDVASAHLAFKETEREKKRLKGEREQIENRFRLYRENESAKNMLIERGKILRRNYEEATAKIQSLQALGTAAELEKRLVALKREQQTLAEEIERATASANAYFAEAEKQKGLAALYSELRAESESALFDALKASGFSSVQEAEKLTLELGDEESCKREYKEFFDRYEYYKVKRSEIDEKKFIGLNETALLAAKERKLALQAERDGLTARAASLETEKKRLVEIRDKYLALEKEKKGKEKTRDLCDELRSLLRNNRFLEFIASEYLQEICFAASKTLLSLTGGRYFLSYEKEFKVGDNLDGGKLRAVKTLSGGETFLVSLSLALSLSAEICRKSLRPIEFFFLDEGFGTLDGKLVDTVMDVLGKLSKNFAVGLISHVEELKHRIENKILVTGATETSGSKLRVESY